MLAKAGSSVRLAKVDTTVEKELGKRFKIEGYPTLKFFQYGDYPAPAPAITPIISPFFLNPCLAPSPGPHYQTSTPAPAPTLSLLWLLSLLLLLPLIVLSLILPLFLLLSLLLLTPLTLF